jgi:hypothetical protein
MGEFCFNPLYTRTFQWHSFSVADPSVPSGWRALPAPEGQRWYPGPEEHCRDIDAQIDQWVDSTSSLITGVSSPSYAKYWADNEQTIMGTVITQVVIYSKPSPVDGKPQHVGSTPGTTPHQRAGVHGQPADSRFDTVFNPTLDGVPNWGGTLDTNQPRRAAPDPFSAD